MLVTKSISREGKFAVGQGNPARSLEFSAVNEGLARMNNRSPLLREHRVLRADGSSLDIFNIPFSVPQASGRRTVASSFFERYVARRSSIGRLFLMLGRFRIVGRSKDRLDRGL